MKAKQKYPLPEKYYAGHDLCFLMHDILVQLLKSGEECRAFTTKIPFKDNEDRKSFENSDDKFEWIEKNRGNEEISNVVITTVFPAILSDTLHCIYEALQASKNAKLNITYMLLRKPLQENLFVLEMIALKRNNFAENLSENQNLLDGTKSGGVERNSINIENVLGIINDKEFFNSEYISRLRYDKSSEDSFDGICNHAMHLFTSHKSIKTEPMNINFIFSDWESKESQWSYIYSRLPYLMFYIYLVVTYVAETISPTHPDYLNDMRRRILSSVVIWWDSIEPMYRTVELENFFEQAKLWLIKHCKDCGYNEPDEADLYRMSQTGAYPGQSKISLKKRNFLYNFYHFINRKNN